MAIAVQFYALLPIIALFSAGLARRLGAKAGFIIFLASLGTISALADRLTDNSRISTIPLAGLLVGQPSVWNWLAVFGCGMARAFVYVHLKNFEKRTGSTPKGLGLLGSALFVLGVSGALAIAFVPTLHNIPLKTQFYGVVYSCILAGILFGARLLRRPFEWRPIRFVGLISYSVYIVTSGIPS
jgi:peptidoglycan/LPS O-acetylase OafA/YrhL